MTIDNLDLDTLASEATPVTLVSGLEIEVDRLRTRALISLLKILTRGASAVLGDLSFSADTTADEFTGQLLAAILFAVPEAENETVEFVNRMVSPAGIKTGNQLSKEDQAANTALVDRLRSELDDPELDDLLTIVSEIVRVESPHILALGKRLSVLLEVQQKSAEAKQGSSKRTDSSKRS